MDRLQKMDRSHGPLQIVHDFQFVALNVRDDYSMLDGRINNGKSALAEDKKPSVLEQLKAKDIVPKTPKPPKKTKEHEL